jgi:hypothetical protein
MSLESVSNFLCTAILHYFARSTCLSEFEKERGRAVARILVIEAQSLMRGKPALITETMVILQCSRLKARSI